MDLRDIGTDVINASKRARVLAHDGEVIGTRQGCRPIGWRLRHDDGHTQRRRAGLNDLDGLGMAFT